MSAGIEKPSFSSGLAVANGGQAAAFFGSVNQTAMTHATQSVTK
jgi:hypothetical protein